MTVLATCVDCRDEHPVADRRSKGGTTACPSCGSTRYVSHSTSDPIQKPESERIRDAIKDVDGVGDKNLAAVLDRYTTLAELEKSDVDELASIEGVGRKTASNIRNHLRTPIGGFEFVGEAGGAP